MITIAICDRIKKNRQEIKRLCEIYLLPLSIKYQLLFFSNEKEFLNYDKEYDLLFFNTNMSIKELEEKKQFISERNKSIIVYLIDWRMIGDENEFKSIIPKIICGQLFEQSSKKYFTFVFAYKEKQEIEIHLEGSVKRDSIKSEDIIYLYAQDKYTILAAKSYQEIDRRSLSMWETLLPREQFLRIHRKRVINLSYIIEIKVDMVILRNGEKFNISRRKQKEVKNKYLEYCLKTKN